MYKRYTLLLLLAALPAIGAFAQRTPRYTVSGFMTDGISAESLISATVYNKASMAGTSTNQYGFYSLTMPEGEVELVFSYVGYNTDTRRFYLGGDTVINMNLEGAVHLQELQVSANRTSRIQETAQMSAINVPIAQVKSLPAFLGEVDVLKTLQLMPGIQSGGEGTSGLYVRGGGPDQNLILLDGVPVYNVSHLFGFFSVFNADAINSMEIIKGGFPARYGGRVSSVLDINMKEGNMQKFGGEGSVGLVAAKLTLEGPIVKNRTSFIVSGRRTYIDALIAPVLAIANTQNENEKYTVGYYFYDLTAKINHRFSAKDRIYLSAYIGDDKFHAKEETKSEYADYYGKSSHKGIFNAGIKWGNITSAFRWNHIFTNRLFGNTTITYSRFRFNMYSDEKTTDEYTYYHNLPDGIKPEKMRMSSSFTDMQYISGIHDWSAKIAFDFMPSPDHYVRFGANAIYHTFNPGVMAVRDTVETHKLVNNDRRYAWEYAAYAEDDVKISQNMKINVGVHWSAFAIDGRFYNYLQPRIAARYLITPQLSAKAAYSRMAQYVHLITNSNLGMPTDLWVPSTPLLRPQTSDQIAAGMAHNFRDDYEISIEAYWKTMKNVLEYREGTGFFDIEGTWEDKIVQGDGRSYGVELFAQKKTGTFTGWVGYTLSWTDRQFDELNGGRRFSYKYDRRHDLSIALMKRFGSSIEASVTWVFGSGNCVTVPIAIYETEHPMGKTYGRDMFSPQYDYGERNGYRMKPYHRLDLSIAFIKEKKWGERRWIIGVYNAYSRKNPFYIDIEQKYLPAGTQFKYVQYSLFQIIPSISYNFKF